MKRTAATLTTAALLAASASLTGQGGRPVDVAVTWFGVTNHLYQVGDVSFMLDGAVSSLGGDLPPDEAVGRVWDALAAGGATDPRAFFVGHDHGDHSEDSLRWAYLFPDARIYGPASLCERLAEGGIGARCTSWTPANTDGTTAIALGSHVAVRPLRWLHSSHTGCQESGRPDTPTFAYLITVNAVDGLIAILANDSGTSIGLTREIVDEAGRWTAPFESLTNALRSAGVDRLTLWQGGSETRLLRQARYVVPLARPMAFQPQHWADRSNDLFQGIGWNYFPGPAFERYLADHNVTMFVQDNFFAALEVRPDGVAIRPTGAVRSVAGLPPTGPGPRTLISHPRLAEVPTGECEQD